MGFPLAAARGFLTVREPLTAEHKLWGIWVSVVVAPGLQSTGLVIVANRLSLSVARGIFPDQGSKPCLLPWWKVKVLVTQLYLTLCHPMDYSLPGSTVHGIFQASDSDSEEPACNGGDLVSIPEFGRSPGEGKGNPLQHPWLGNSRDRGAWQAADHEVSKSRPRLSNYHTCIHTLEWVVNPSSRALPTQRWTLISTVFAGWFFPTEPSEEPGLVCAYELFPLAASSPGLQQIICQSRCPLP